MTALTYYQMTSATYQTLAPDSLSEFCQTMGILFGQVERSLFRDLTKGSKLNDLKRQYQVDFGINARQFNSIYASIKGKIASRQETFKLQVNQLTNTIKGLEKSVKKLTKKLKGIRASCGVGKAKSPRGLLRWSLHQKKRRLAMLKDRLSVLKSSTPSIIFAGKRLWMAQFNLEANGYETHQDWLLDWREARSSQFMLVGSKDETRGNQNCQLSPEGSIKINVPRALESQFGKYITASGIKLAYGQDDINYALEKGKSLTYRFVRKNGKWYIFCTVERPQVPSQSRYANGMLRVDLNPSVIGWSYIESVGNLKVKGQIRINLRDRSKEQVKATLGDACKQLVEIAQSYQCPMTIESLDFSRKKASMREAGNKYSRMLSNFAYSEFGEILASRCERFGIELVHINPAYSSLIGCLKFMRQYGLSSDTAAALVLARRALRLSERLPARIARTVPVDTARHVWSAWGKLGKRLGGVRRHRFFAIREANSSVEVILQRESE